MTSESLDSSNSIWASPSEGFDDWATIQAHVSDYSRRTKRNLEKLNKIWSDIGLSKEDQREQLVAVDENINRVWNTAVEMAEAQKQDFQEKLDEAVEEIYKIKEDLGELKKQGQRSGIEGLLRLDSLVGSTLKSRYESVQKLLSEWKGKKEMRFVEYKKLHGLITKAKLRLGDTVISKNDSPRLADISLSNLGKLQQELEDYKIEVAKRERELEALISKLTRICIELNENDVEIASQAHPSLRFYREALQTQFSLVRPSFSNQPDIRTDLKPEEKELDLSVSTFMALETKINEVIHLKAEREEQCKEISYILNNLWEVLKIEEDDIDRGIHMRLLEGPKRLHAKSMEECMVEIERLEKTYAQILWGLIEKKSEDLRHVCDATRLPMPDLTPLYQSNDGEKCSVGQISDALSKISEMVDKTKEISEKRAPIIYQIEEIEKASEEVNWLFAYENDEDRYKGRDSNRKLQRALKAGRVRDRMPSMISKLKEDINKWQMEEENAFVYENQDYMVILDNLEMTLKANMAAKLNAAKNVGGKANGNNANGYRTKERPPSRSRSRASNNLSNPANKCSSSVKQQISSNNNNFELKKQAVSQMTREQSIKSLQGCHSSMAGIPEGVPSGRCTVAACHPIEGMYEKEMAAIVNNHIRGSSLIDYGRETRSVYSSSHSPPPMSNTASGYSLPSTNTSGYNRYINSSINGGGSSSNAMRTRPDSACSTIPLNNTLNDHSQTDINISSSKSDNTKASNLKFRKSQRFYSNKVIDEDLYTSTLLPSKFTGSAEFLQKTTMKPAIPINLTRCSSKKSDSGNSSNKSARSNSSKAESSHSRHSLKNQQDDCYKPS